MAKVVSDSIWQTCCEAYKSIIESYKSEEEQANALKCFFLECASKNDVLKMGDMFYYLTKYTKFPLEKINLCGDNDVSVYRIIVQAEFSGPSRDFLREFDYQCSIIKGLEEKSDKYYYSIHPEALEADALGDSSDISSDIDM